MTIPHPIDGKRVAGTSGRTGAVTCFLPADRDKRSIEPDLKSAGGGRTASLEGA